jgi:hypothetical protein
MIKNLLSLLVALSLLWSSACYLAIARAAAFWSPGEFSPPYAPGNHWLPLGSLGTYVDQFKLGALKYLVFAWLWLALLAGVLTGVFILFHLVNALWFRPSSDSLEQGERVQILFAFAPLALLAFPPQLVVSSPNSSHTNSRCSTSLRPSSPSTSASRCRGRLIPGSGKPNSRGASLSCSERPSCWACSSPPRTEGLYTQTRPTFSVSICPFPPSSLPAQTHHHPHRRLPIHRLPVPARVHRVHDARQTVHDGRHRRGHQSGCQS